MKRWQAIAQALAVFLIVTTLAAGCAKRPVTLGASAQAPAHISPPVSGPSGAQRPASTPSRSSRAGSSPAPRPSQFTPAAALRDIHFDFDRYDLRAADIRLLDMNAAWLKDNSDTLLLIEGHADERGTDQYNLSLGDRRAKAAMDYLVAQGVQASRINLISYGEERPLCVERSETCWARNRRAHFLVKGK